MSHVLGFAQLCRTYVFPKLLPQPSEVLAVELPRPLGLVFEYDERLRQAVCVDVVRICVCMCARVQTGGRVDGQDAACARHCCCCHRTFFGLKVVLGLTPRIRVL